MEIDLTNEGRNTLLLFFSLQRYSDARRCITSVAAVGNSKSWYELKNDPLASF